MRVRALAKRGSAEFLPTHPLVRAGVQGVTLNRRDRFSMIDSLVSVGSEIMSLYPYPLVLAK